MSAESEKSMVMSAMAYFATDRSILWSGMPSICCSIGVMTFASTSSGVMPGAFRISFTCVGAMSGKASIGRVANDQTPMAATSSESASTVTRLRSDHSTRRRSMSVRRLRLQLGQAGYRNCRAGRHPLHDRRPAIRHAAH